MCTVLFSVTLFVFGLAFQGGNAAPECPLHPDNLLIYFDIEQISMMKLQHDFTGLFQSPLMCRTGKDKDCKDQRCCGTEEGCCLTDSTSQYGKCGCREMGQSKCSYPAPLAVLGKTECNKGNQRKVVTCLREHRTMEQEYKVGKNSTWQAVIEEKRNLGEMERTHRQKDRVGTHLHIDFNVNLDDSIDLDKQRPDVIDADLKNIFLQQFTAEELAKNLHKNVIDNLIEYVVEQKNKGQSYGLPQ